ncbi:MAG: hypothetical protein PVF83_00590 [Anaerolineales bacterium]
MTVKNTGTLTDAEENRKMTAEALAAAEKHNSTKCLIDNRDLNLEMKTIDVYDVPDVLGEVGVPRNYKVAIIISESLQDTKGFRFYETRAFNKGFNHRLFTDFDTALDWLTDREPEE